MAVGSFNAGSRDPRLGGSCLLCNQPGARPGPIVVSVVAGFLLFRESFTCYPLAALSQVPMGRAAWERDRVVGCVGFCSPSSPAHPLSGPPRRSWDSCNYVRKCRATSLSTLAAEIDKIKGCFRCGAGLELVTLARITTKVSHPIAAIARQRVTKYEYTAR